MIRNKPNPYDAVDIPEDYLCPITREPMEKPVVAADGFSYEEVAIKQWIALGHQISPKTGARLDHTTLIPNLTLRTIIHSFKEELPKIQQKKLTERDLEVQITQYDARWHLIMLNALLENVELRSTTLFHTTRNNSIHRFEHIDPKTELDNLEIICKEELSPFMRQQEENRTVAVDPDSLTLVTSDTAISSPSTADTTVATLPVTKKLRLSTDSPSEERKISGNNLL